MDTDLLKIVVRVVLWVQVISNGRQPCISSKGVKRGSIVRQFFFYQFLNWFDGEGFSVRHGPHTFNYHFFTLMLNHEKSRKTFATSLHR